MQFFQVTSLWRECHTLLSSADSFLLHMPLLIPATGPGKGRERPSGGLQRLWLDTRMKMVPSHSMATVQGKKKAQLLFLCCMCMQLKNLAQGFETEGRQQQQRTFRFQEVFEIAFFLFLGGIGFLVLSSQCIKAQNTCCLYKIPLQWFVENSSSCPQEREFYFVTLSVGFRRLVGGEGFPKITLIHHPRAIVIGRPWCVDVVTQTVTCLCFGCVAQWSIPVFSAVDGPRFL